MHKILLLLASSLTIMTTTNAADIKLRPGLWEVTGHNKGQKSFMQALLPPEQMRLVESMSKEAGINLKNKLTTYERECFTQEMVNRKLLSPTSDSKEVAKATGCEMKVTEQVGNRYKWNLICKTSQSKGEGEFLILSPEKYTGWQEMNITPSEGTSKGMRSDFEGRWINANCGAVEPDE